MPTARRATAEPLSRLTQITAVTRSCAIRASLLGRVGVARRARSSRRPTAARAGVSIQSVGAGPARARTAPGAPGASPNSARARAAASATTSRPAQRVDAPGRAGRPGSARWPRRRAAAGPRRRSPRRRPAVSAPNPARPSAGAIAKTSGTPAPGPGVAGVDEGDRGLLGRADDASGRRSSSRAGPAPRSSARAGRRRPVADAEAELVGQQEVGLGHPVRQRAGRQLGPLAGGVVVEGDQRTASAGPPARRRTGLGLSGRHASGAQVDAAGLVGHVRHAGADRHGRRGAAALRCRALVRRRWPPRPLTCWPSAPSTSVTPLDRGRLRPAARPGSAAASVLAWLCMPAGYWIWVVARSCRRSSPTVPILKPAVRSWLALRVGDAVLVRAVEHVDRDGRRGDGRRARTSAESAAMPISASTKACTSAGIRRRRRCRPRCWRSRRSGWSEGQVALGQVRELAGQAEQVELGSVSSEELTALSRLVAR